MELARLIDASIASRVAGEEKVAVAFSGGLDSSLLVVCAKRHAEIVACSAFVKGAYDSVWVAGAGRLLSVESATVEVEEGQMARDLERARLPFPLTPMDRSLWCIYSAAARLAKEKGARVLLLGQMADELFGGYAKYTRALEQSGEGSALEMMEADAGGFPSRGRLRDSQACSPWAEARFPFEDQGIVGFASSLPVSFRIREGVRKAVLRDAALILGVPDQLARAPKKAAQYSSGVQRALSGSRF